MLEINILTEELIENQIFGDPVRIRVTQPPPNSTNSRGTFHHCEFRQGFILELLNGPIETDILFFDCIILNQNPIENMPFEKLTLNFYNCYSDNTVFRGSTFNHIGFNNCLGSYFLDQGVNSVQ